MATRRFREKKQQSRVSFFRLNNNHVFTFVDNRERARARDKKKKKAKAANFVTRITWRLENRKFHLVVVQNSGKEMYKKMGCRC